MAGIYCALMVKILSRGNKDRTLDTCVGDALPAPGRRVKIV
jgi:hypothetical protein